MDLLALRYIATISIVSACALLGWQSADAAERKAVVRVTTGSVQINNWQKNLVDSNPNLGHWHWNPIYANVQGLKTVRANAGPDKFRRRHGPAILHPNVTVRRISAPQQSVYIRPNHIPFNTTPRKETNVAAVLRAPDVNANLSHHVGASLRNNQVNGALAQRQVNGTLAQRDVNATLSQNKTNARLADRNVSGEMLPAAPQPPAPPRVATYGQSYNSGDDFAGLSRGSTNHTEKSSVYGRITMPKKSHVKKSNLNY